MSDHTNCDDLMTIAGGGGGVNSSSTTTPAIKPLPRIVAPPHRPSIALTGAEASIWLQSRRSVFDEA